MKCVRPWRTTQESGNGISMEHKTYARMLELKDELVGYRRYLHQCPELGFDLPQTRAFVLEKLKEFGYEPQTVGRAGITCTVGRGGGKTLLLRGDMDALPMAEETGLPFASQNGCMHACGHDFHTTGLLGAAKVLKEWEDELEGTVKLLFQPAEETMDGAADVYNAGILEKPHVDAALALHVVHAPLGTAGYTPGHACGSSDVFTVTIHGKGGHGAAPHENIDPINAAAHIILALQEINSREINPNQMIVLTVCSLHAGSAANVMPGEAVLKGTIRTMDLQVKEFARQRMREICEGVCSTFRATCDIDFIGGGIPPMVNDNALAEEIGGYIDDMLGAGTTYHIERMTGSEDFSVFSQKVPSALFWFGTGSTEQGYAYGVHDPRVTFNEDAIPMMAAVYAESAFRWLREHHCI